jgi:hypothetical protein
LAATDELPGEEVDWSGFDPTGPSVHQTREQKRNLMLAELDEVHTTRASLEARELDLIRVAKFNGATWKEIGDAIKSSRQAAHRAYAHLVE